MIVNLFFIIVPTVIHVAPQNLTLGVDDREARFRCEASSDDSTPITITWRRDGEKIVYGEYVYFFNVQLL